MTTITISIGTLQTKVRSQRAHDKGPAKEISIKIDWRTLRKARSAAKDYSLARLRDLLNRYDKRLKQKTKERMTVYPKHSILCEKSCCQKSNKHFWRFLEKELVWGLDGHLK